MACEEEKPKDYLSFSGTITNANSDSIVIYSKEYRKVIKLNADGSFSDTLKVAVPVQIGISAILNRLGYSGINIKKI